MNNRIAALVIVICASIFPASAGAISLTLGPDGPASAQDQVAVLYASRADGSTVAIARVGDLTIDGGEIAELGIPSETPDGRVVFGANVEDRAGRLGWSIFTADPNAPAPDRISYALMPLALSGRCTPSLKVDPYPIATADGGLAFVAPRREGGDALFLYRGGHVDCLLRTGDRLPDGREVAGLSFGTVQAGAGNSIAMIVTLRRAVRDKARPSVWWRDDLQAVVMVSPEQGVSEIAVEGSPAPRGGVFGSFGPPAAAATSDGRQTLVAFSERRASGTSIFLFRDGRVTRVLSNGSTSPAGRVNYLSQTRPSLGPRGAIAVRGASGEHQMILLWSPGAVRVMAEGGETLTPDVTLSSFGDPWIVAGSRIYFPAAVGNVEGLFVRDGSGAVHELGQPAVREAAFGDTAAPRHRVSSATLSANPRGDFTYLGSR